MITITESALRRALEPFAKMAPEWDGEPDSLEVELRAYDDRMCPGVSVADFRRAREALAALTATHPQGADDWRAGVDVEIRRMLGAQIAPCVDSTNMQGCGSVCKIGWDVDDTGTEVFRAVIDFLGGPPTDLPIDIVWNAVPVRIVALPAPPATPTHPIRRPGDPGYRSGGDAEAEAGDAITSSKRGRAMSAVLYTMKKRPRGFLADCNLDHDTPQFDYLRELHEILWRFVKAEMPGASGDLSDFIPTALYLAEQRSACIAGQRGDAT